MFLQLILGVPSVERKRREKNRKRFFTLNLNGFRFVTVSLFPRYFFANVRAQEIAASPSAWPSERLMTGPLLPHFVEALYR